MQNKVVRTICLFREKPTGTESQELSRLEQTLIQKGYLIQTKRLCSPVDFGELDQIDSNILLSVGCKDYEYVMSNLSKMLSSRDNFNVDLTNENFTLRHTELLFEIIKKAPHKTFQFTYVFNNCDSSPYMPSANYKKDGFAIGLQPTDLAAGSDSLEMWFKNMKDVYDEIISLFSDEKEFIGIDSSIAPLYEGDSSLVNFIRKLHTDFSSSVTSNTYLQITKSIKENNPKPTGLCGLMLPCLEDFELAEEYEKGNFSIERNIFMSLHSGLGIDTYPIGIDESPDTVLQIMKLIQGLSNKYTKPLSIRFVSDGKAKIGEKTDFKNQYLKDIVVRGI